MKVQLLIKTYMLKDKDFSRFKLSDAVHVFIIINVKMPTIDVILTFVSMINFMLS